MLENGDETDRFRDEPWQRYDLTVEMLKEQISNLKARIVKLDNIIKDLDYCRTHTCIGLDPNTTCSFCKGGADYCGLHIDERMGRLGKD